MLVLRTVQAAHIYSIGSKSMMGFYVLLNFYMELDTSWTARI